MPDNHKLKVEGRGAGELYWNKNSGDLMMPIPCPYTGRTCRASCPFVICSNIEITFYCMPTSPKYFATFMNGEKTP